MINSLVLKITDKAKNKSHQRLSRYSLALEKIIHWEYWPLYIVYLPVFIYWIWLSLKARSLFFFSASNPSIDTGGMLGASKSKILDLIPDKYKAKTLLVSQETSFNDLLEKVKLNFSFPVIAKPDIGERGFKVEKIENENHLVEYFNSINKDFIIQEYVDYPIELGLFYYRFPDADTGVISSITLKEFLKVTGDGASTVKELMEDYPRAAFQLKRLEAKLGNSINYIPIQGEICLLEPIGNHCRGTKFLNGNHFIDSQLVQTFDIVSKSIPGFYYGRFDLRCKSITQLKEGKDFKILELNGAASEPAHIYHPGFSLLSAYKVLFGHWKVLFQISKENHKKGVQYLSFREALTEWGKWGKAKSNNETYTKKR